MEKVIGQPKKVKTKSGRVGSFFLGTFIGFLLTLALLAGAVSFVYFNVSADWINKHFKAGIDLPYNLNSMTLKDVVGGAINLSRNLQNYTLDDLKKDFGVNIDNEIFGLDISDIKSTALSNLTEAIKNKFQNISAYDLRKIVSGIEDNKILNVKLTYYLRAEDPNTLYKDEACQDPVTASDFEYKIENNVVKIKNRDVANIQDNQTSIEIKYLPVKTAFTSLNVSGEMKLKDLEEMFDIELPSILNSVKDSSINELGTAIEGIQISEFLGYKVQPDGSVTDGDGNPVSAIEKFLATKTVGSLSNLTITLGDVFEEKYFEKGNLLYLFADEESQKTSVEELPKLLNEKFQTASLNTLKDLGLLSEEELSKGIMSLLTEADKNSCTILTLPQKIQEKVGDATLGELIDAKLINANIDGKYINVGTIKEPEYVLLSSLKLSQLMDALLKSGVLSDSPTGPQLP